MKGVNMTVSNNQGGAQTNDSGANGGQGETNENQNQGGGTADGKTVSFDDHKRALDDLHKYKKTSKDLEEKIQKLTNDLTNLKQSGLKSANDYKTYSEQLEKEREDLKAENSNLKKGFGDTFKHMELKAEATKLGIRESALNDLNFLDLSEIGVEFTDKGRVTVTGAKEFAESLKKTRGHWFKDGNAANINTGGKGGSTDGVITVQQLHELEKKDPKAYKVAFAKFAKQKAAGKPAQ